MPELSACVDDEDLFSFARGDLPPSEVARVEAHLRDCSDCRTVLAEAARSLELPDSPVAGAGDGVARVARYEIRELIGAGASGVVYRAFDPDLRRVVALKVLRPDLHGSSPELSAWMLREAQAMARLSSSHVVAVYDVGIQGGTVYLVMEHIDGSTIAEWLKAAPRSTPEILRAFDDAGQGLLAAHQKGLVHRDFKPENVLISATGRALVTDFGLARESERSALGHQPGEGGKPDELFAPTRGLVGTPAYMAPELFDGQKASAKSDQYSFCVALFVALFDKHPFGAGEGLDLAEVLLRARASAVEAVSNGRVHSERLLAALRRGLSPDPEARFPDMRSLLSAVDRAQRRSLGRVRLMLGLASVMGLGAVALFLVNARDRSAPEPRRGQRVELAATATSIRETARSGASAAARLDTLPLAEPLPLASASAAASSSVRPPDLRKAPRKPAEVRYRDWLKEPF